MDIGMWFRGDLANVLRGVAVSASQTRQSAEWVMGFIADLEGVATVLGITPEELRTKARPVTGNADAFESRAEAGRYRPTGRVSETDDPECIDTHTGRRGIMHSWVAGFVPGAYVRDDGRIDSDHPHDNPLYGWRA